MYSSKEIEAMANILDDIEWDIQTTPAEMFDSVDEFKKDILKQIKRRIAQVAKNRKDSKL